MTKIKVAFFAFSIFILSGCMTAMRTNPIPHQMAVPVPADRLIAYTQPKNDYARIIVTRDSGVSGSGCYLGLVIDSTLSARFAPGETATFYVPKNTEKFAVVHDPYGKGLCSVPGFEPYTENYSLDPNKPNLFRINFGLDHTFRLLPTIY